MAALSMKQLLEAGVHFGHQTRRWHPKMAPYIFGERNGIHIIDLQKTVKKIKEAVEFLRRTAEGGGLILFVGTKKQAQDAIREEAERCGMFYVNHRWLGGMLTNFSTIRKSIAYLKNLERLTEEELQQRSKKEQAKLLKERAKLQRALGGIKDMDRLPSALFIIDTKKERNAILEARKLGIPVVAVVDTNCDPEEVNYPIPGNDDAIRAIKMMAALAADAVLEGRAQELEGREAGTAEKQLPEETSEDFPEEEARRITEEMLEEMGDAGEGGEEGAEKRVVTGAELDNMDVEHLAGDAEKIAEIATDYTDEKVERIRSRRSRED